LDMELCEGGYRLAILLWPIKDDLGLKTAGILFIAYTTYIGGSTLDK